MPLGEGVRAVGENPTFVGTSRIEYDFQAAQVPPEGSPEEGQGESHSPASGPLGRRPEDPDCQPHPTPAPPRDGKFQLQTDWPTGPPAPRAARLRFPVALADLQKRAGHGAPTGRAAQISHRTEPKPVSLASSKLNAGSPTDAPDSPEECRRLSDTQSVPRTVPGTSHNANSSLATAVFPPRCG